MSEATIDSRLIYLARVQRGWWAIKLCSGDEERPRCHLLLIGFGWFLQVFLPPILPPHRYWKDLSKYEWATPPKGYWKIVRRELGVSLSSGHLSVKYGQQDDDSSVDRHWGCFLPWTQWRNVRHSMYGLSGEHYWTEAPKGKRNWDDWHKAREACPRAKFLIEDYDGAQITASAYIEEREYRWGEKWCSWLSIFRRPRIYRSLNIEFSAEVGSDKGSWKGGMTGHSIDMLPGELHEAAFRRYCDEPVRNKYGQTAIKFLGNA